MVLGRLKRAIEERKLVKQAERKIREKEINDLANKLAKEYGLSKKEALALAKRKKREEEASKGKRSGNPFFAFVRFFAPPEVVARKKAERMRELRRKKEEFSKVNKPNWLIDSSGPSWLNDFGGPSWLLEDNRRRGRRR